MVHQNVIIFADNREMSSKVVSILKKKCGLKIKQLDTDYLLSSDVACERKTSEDFLQSIVDGRLFRQLKGMKAYKHPILIIEGDLEFNRIHPNAVRGAIASIATEFSVPIVWTKNQLETAEMLYTIAKREQLEKKKSIAIRTKKKAKSMNQLQEFLVAGLPKISTATAKKLLKHFKTPEKLFIASESELMAVNGIGKELAKQIRSVLVKEYEKSILEE
jgi:ERCC4-type nuclease